MRKNGVFAVFGAFGSEPSCRQTRESADTTGASAYARHGSVQRGGAKTRANKKSVGSDEQGCVCNMEMWCAVGGFAAIPAPLPLPSLVGGDVLLIN